MPIISQPRFPFSFHRKEKPAGYTTGILANTILGNTMAAASNTLRKSVARAAARKNLSGYKVTMSW